MSDREDIIKEISARIRIYKPKTDDAFPIEITFPNEFLSKKGKEPGKFYNKIETDKTLKLPVVSPIKAIYTEDHSLSNEYLKSFRSTSDIYSKIIYINRAIDHDLLAIAKYQNAIEYYETLEKSQSQSPNEQYTY